MADELLRGIDISHWQDAERIDWAKLRETHQFVICRAAYGTMRDREVVEHVRHARREAFSIGLYQFFRACQDVQKQFDVLRVVDDDCGYESGDIVPGMDVEDDPGAPLGQRSVRPEWSAPAEQLSTLLVEQYGNASNYLTQRDWVRLGRPGWVLDRPLWVAHWTEHPEPATPNDEAWAMWQHRVGKLPGVYPGDLDQNVSRDLILVPHDGPLGMTRGECERVEGLVELTAWQSYEDSREKGRP